ncbi:MAG: hypothetical protein H6891_03155 [Brucellaceae bacterium]|nr:hypothetical protein [Brucellaceae bacterium]
MLAATMAARPAADEHGWFHIPDEREVRLQTIRRQDREAGWPFVSDEGYLTCVFALGQRIVVFVPQEEAEKDNPGELPKAVALSANPFEMLANMIEGGSLLQPMKTPEELIQRIAPFVEIGRALCDQPQGSLVPGGEL